jgi:hypothetical protein
MKRALVWTSGGAAILAAAVLWLRPDTRAEGAQAAAQGATVLPAPSTPPDASSAAAPTGSGGPATAAPGADRSATPGLPASAGVLPGPGIRDPAMAKYVEEDLRRREEFHQRRREEHHAEVKDRAEKKKQEIAARQADHRTQRALFEATRAPDPNRPPIERLEVGPGPGYVAAPPADAGATQ